jgi:hypothetical protein
MVETRPRRMTLLRYIAYTGGLLSLGLVILAILFAFERLNLGGRETDPGVALATTGLALFTGLLFFAGAVTAYFAYDEITTSAAANKLSADANKATLALQMDNRFVGDRALRIRHGAVTFLAKYQRKENGEPRRSVDLHCPNPDRISPYSTDETNRWNDLPSDLIDLFNYFDWIGYLAIEKPETIDLEVVAQKFGPWIRNYYQLCENEIEHILSSYPARWRYLKPLYNALIKDEEEDWNNARKNNSPPYRAKREEHELDAFLLREHVRSHRGASPYSGLQ